MKTLSPTPRRRPQHLPDPPDTANLASGFMVVLIGLLGTLIAVIVALGFAALIWLL